MQEYLDSRWIKAGLILLAIATVPLLLVIAFSALPGGDPRPNPIGPGLLFLVFFWPSILCLVIGAIQVRRGATRRLGR